MLKTINIYILNKSYNQYGYGKTYQENDHFNIRKSSMDLSTLISTIFNLSINCIWTLINTISVVKIVNLYKYK
jgi:hypothetical protein